MKINQLFVKHVDQDMLNLVMDCYGLTGLEDRRFFTKADLAQMGTVAQLEALVPRLRDYYLPCKARVYLQNITDKKCITILKQILKLHGHVVLSKERNSRHQKVVLYQLVSEQERNAVLRVEVRHDVTVDLKFS